MRNERTFIILCLITVFLFNCCVKKQEPKPKPHLKLAIAYDLSGSTQKFKTPALTTDQVDSLLHLIEKRGGELAFASIHSFSYRPLIRLKLEQVSGRLDERARLNQKNKNELSSFRYSVFDILKQPRRAQRTDLFGAVTRIMLFFEEPARDFQTEKFLLLISDGIDDVGQPRESSPILMPLNLNVVTVGVRPTIAQQLFGGQAVLFESISPAIVYIRESSTELKEF